MLPLPLPDPAAGRARAELRRRRRARHAAGDHGDAAVARGVQARHRRRPAADRPPAPVRGARHRVHRAQGPPRPRLPDLRAERAASRRRGPRQVPRLRALLREDRVGERWDSRERTAKARHGLGRLRPLLGRLAAAAAPPARRRPSAATASSASASSGLASIHHAEVAGRGRRGSRRSTGPGASTRSRATSASRHSTRGLREGITRHGRSGDTSSRRVSSIATQVATLNVEIDRLAAAGTIRGHHRRPALHEHSPAAPRRRGRWQAIGA